MLCVSTQPSLDYCKSTCTWAFPSVCYIPERPALQSVWQQGWSSYPPRHGQGEAWCRTYPASSPPPAAEYRSQQVTFLYRERRAEWKVQAIWKTSRQSTFIVLVTTCVFCGTWLSCGLSIPGWAHTASSLNGGSPAPRWSPLALLQHTHQTHMKFSYALWPCCLSI